MNIHNNTEPTPFTNPLSLQSNIDIDMQLELYVYGNCAGKLIKHKTIICN